MSAVGGDTLVLGAALAVAIAIALAVLVVELRRRKKEEPKELVGREGNINAEGGG